MTLDVLSKDQTPAESQVLLDQLQKGIGMVPNFHAMIAASPQALKGYMTLHQLATETAFTADEVTVVWQSINVEHACHYCVPAHTAVANDMGLARMPCYVGDTEPRIRRLDLKLTPSTWGIWILSHVDLRSTARVRVARDFLIDVIEKQRDLILGNKSRYRE